MSMKWRLRDQELSKGEVAELLIAVINGMAKHNFASIIPQFDDKGEKLERIDLHIGNDYASIEFDTPLEDYETVLVEDY